MQDRRSFFGYSYLSSKRKWLRIDSIDLGVAINTALAVWPCGRVGVGFGVSVGVGFGVSVAVGVGVRVGVWFIVGKKKPPLGGVVFGKGLLRCGHYIKGEH